MPLQVWTLSLVGITRLKSNVENCSRTNADVAGFPSAPTLDKKINIRQCTEFLLPWVPAKRPFLIQAGDPRYRSSLGVEQPIRKIFVSLAPCLHVFRHLARCWPSQGDTIRLIRSCVAVGAAPDICGATVRRPGWEQYPLFVPFSAGASAHNQRSSNTLGSMLTP